MEVRGGFGLQGFHSTGVWRVPSLWASANSTNPPRLPSAARGNPLREFPGWPLQGGLVYRGFELRVFLSG